MSRGPKATKHERIRIDFAIEFKDAHNGVRFGGQEDFARLERAIFNVLQEQAEREGIEAMRDVRISFGLDNRKRDGNGVLVRP